MSHDLNDQPSRNKELQVIVGARVRELVIEMYVNGWEVGRVLFAINDAIKQRWLARIDGATGAPLPSRSEE